MSSPAGAWLCFARSSVRSLAANSFASRRLSSILSSSQTWYWSWVVCPAALSSSHSLNCAAMKAAPGCWLWLKRVESFRLGDLSVCVDGEGVFDCECRDDFLCSGWMFAVGGLLIDCRHSKNRLTSGSSLITVTFSLPLGLFLFLAFSFTSVFSLGAILLAKFTGPDWPVRGCSSCSWNTGSRVVGKWQR